eukprot:2653031-Prymnesium_polylepis.1
MLYRADGAWALSLSGAPASCAAIRTFRGRRAIGSALLTPVSPLALDRSSVGGVAEASTREGGCTQFALRGSRSACLTNQ